ncbi:MAG: methyltransferase [Muribaculaceae bacterium]|nr:methyltransferase [Muribaculaceae bacterium]
MAREKIFRFKKFNLLNDKTAMKVGTDGVLLGAWCEVAGAKRVLDVGTGCGLIALMVAQRNHNAAITAIDIDQNAIDEAIINIANSPWSNRVDALCADFNNFAAQEPFDLIVSNPPFFTENVMAPDKSRNLARHSVTLTIEQLISNSKLMLADDGTLSFISPVEQELYVRTCVVKAAMSIKRLARVVPVEGAAPKRLMWELVKCPKEPKEEQLIIRHADASYFKQYIDLTRDFYLNL